VKRFHLILSIVVALAVTISTDALAEPPPKEWDGLVRVQSQRMNYLYLRRGADFRSYTKVILEPTEVAFRKDWIKEHNRSQRSVSRRISNSDVQRAITEGIKASSDIFSKAWQAGGYTLATAPGSDVLRVKTGILNIDVSAPDQMGAGRAHTFANEAGRATLVVEVRDSLTGTLLGRAVDQQIAGDFTAGARNSVTNRSDFRALAEQWATDSVKGMAELKARSPIAP
jgi:hypothetical protein